MPFVQWAHVGGIIVGFGTLLVALFMALPVAVNLPDSWFGAVLALAMGSIGVALIVGNAREIRAKRGGGN
jgi:hypothetical protein